MCDWQDSQCRSLNPSAQKSDVYKLFFSYANIGRIADRVERMGFPRPATDGDGIYRQLYRIYQIYPGYQGVGPTHWTHETLIKHVEFMNERFFQLYIPDLYAKQALYDAYDRDRSSPLRTPDIPFMDYCTRRAPIFTGRLMR